jgi:hypothetical protein
MLFALLVLSSLAMVEAVFAQSVTKPSVPEFTVKIVSHPYDIPTTYYTDPYTGETITNEGAHFENKSIEVWIKNQPFTPYDDAEGREVNLYYNVRVKGHFEDDWSTPITYSGSDSAERIPRSNSEYTVLSLANYYSSKAQVDYQVEAIVGHFYTNYYPPGHSIQFPVSVFQVDETSGWSSTQTIAFGEIQTPSPESTSSPEPTTPTSPTPLPSEEPLGQDVILGVAVTVAVVCVGLGLLVYLIKRK